MVIVESGDTNQLTVIWSPPTMGGVPTSYKITINDSSNSVSTVPDTRSPRYNHTFASLVSNTPYKVSVTAINCAGATFAAAEGYSGIILCTNIVSVWFLF